MRHKEGQGVFFKNQSIENSKATRLNCLSEKKIELPKESSSKLHHLTKSRPIPKHRIPTRIPRDFVMVNKNSSELLGSIKQAITIAEYDYRMRKPLKARGWLTTKRHGTAGLIRAQKFCNESGLIDSFNGVIAKLDDFFTSPKTHYNNHSFATYLLLELNALLKNASLPQAKPDVTNHYNEESWTNIVSQLRLLQQSESEERRNVLP